eukprot:2734038-Pleurochrysis_carterae.AAC.2
MRKAKIVVTEICAHVEATVDLLCCVTLPSHDNSPGAAPLQHMAQSYSRYTLQINGQLSSNLSSNLSQPVACATDCVSTSILSVISLPTALCTRIIYKNQAFNQGTAARSKYITARRYGLCPHGFGTGRNNEYGTLSAISSQRQRKLYEPVAAKFLSRIATASDATDDSARRTATQTPISAALAARLMLEVERFEEGIKYSLESYGH